jgi:hypothetical protein
MTAPVRLQLSRRKGFSLQALSLATNGLPAVNVARPSKWGNPFKVGAHGSREVCVAAFRHAIFRQAHLLEFGADEVISLRGKNLACFCALGSVCHADVLLEIANKPICEAVEDAS